MGGARRIPSSSASAPAAVATRRCDSSSSPPLLDGEAFAAFARFLGPLLEAASAKGAERALSTVLAQGIQPGHATDDKRLKKAEAAKILGCSLRDLNRRIARGQIRVMRLSPRCIRINRDELDRVMREAET